LPEMNMRLMTALKSETLHKWRASNDSSFPYFCFFRSANIAFHAASSANRSLSAFGLARCRTLGPVLFSENERPNWRASVRQLIGRTVLDVVHVAGSLRFDNLRFWERFCDRDSRIRFRIICDVPPLVALRDFHAKAHESAATKMLRQNDQASATIQPPARQQDPKQSIKATEAGANEFGNARARRFDGAARSIPTAARYRFVVRLGRPGPLRLSASP